MDTIHIPLKRKRLLYIYNFLLAVKQHNFFSEFQSQATLSPGESLSRFFGRLGVRLNRRCPSPFILIKNPLQFEADTATMIDVANQRLKC